MKNMRPYLLPLLVLIIVAGCKKKDSAPPAGMQLNISGRQWIADSYFAIREYDSSTGSWILIVQGNDTVTHSGALKIVTLTIPNDNGQTGTIDLSQPKSGLLEYQYDSVNAPQRRQFLSSSGTMTITRRTATNLQGVFSNVVLVNPTPLSSGTQTISGQFNMDLK